MKIGILTFHSANNYGAVIQCYCLQEYIKSCGHEVYVIDYRPNYFGLQQMDFKSIKCSNPLRYLARILLVLFRRPSVVRRNKNFENFRKRYLHLISADILNDANSEFDAFIYGSDQIWEWEIGHCYDKIYFAKFDAAYKALNITYAASLAKVEFDKDRKNSFLKRLTNYSSISVREKEVSDILNQAEIANTVVLDPTLLYPEALIKFNFKAPYKKGDYVLVYKVAECEALMDLAKKVANDLQCNIVEIKMQSIEGPEVFLNLIKHARCVVTTSFHGVAISLIYHVPVYVARVGSHLDLRSEYLVNSFNISDRMMCPADYKAFTNIDFSNVERALDKSQINSRNFLSLALERK